MSLQMGNSRSSGIQVIEDISVPAVMGRSGAPATGVSELSVEEALRDPMVLQAIADVLRQQLPPTLLDPFAPADKRNIEIKQVMRNAIADQRQRGGPLARLPNDDVTLLALFAETLGWGPAQTYLDAGDVNEVKINGTTIFVQEAGRGFKVVPETFRSPEQVRDRAILLASILGVPVDSNNPQATLPLRSGTRMHVSIGPRVVSASGDEESVLVCIRRGRREAWDLNDILKRGTIDENVSALLRLMIKAHCSFLVAGRTGSGKTGMLEAICNTWDPDSHIITIEDHTMEIGVRQTATWTRELVDSYRDPQAFGRVVREAMRQTPDLIILGETRAAEAGAVIALTLTGHAVATTIHARSAAEAVTRLSACASLPGSYMYEGRRDDALIDAAGGFDIVVMIDFWESVGLRVVTEVALVNGAVNLNGVIRPVVVPLVTIDIGEDKQVHWRCEAHVEGDRLVWNDGNDRTPPIIAEKIRQAHAKTVVRSSSGTTLSMVKDAMTQANQLIRAGSPDRAMAIVMRAWSQRPDEQLLRVGQQALSMMADRYAAEVSAAMQVRDSLERAIIARYWLEAKNAYDRILSDGLSAIATMPPDGWEPVRNHIDEGIRQTREAVSVLTNIESLAVRNDWHGVLNSLNKIKMTRLADELRLQLVRHKETAYSALVQAGEMSPETLTVIIAQRSQLEAEMQGR